MTSDSCVSTPTIRLEISYIVTVKYCSYDAAVPIILVPPSSIQTYATDNENLYFSALGAAGIDTSSIDENTFKIIISEVNDDDSNDDYNDDSPTTSSNKNRNVVIAVSSIGFAIIFTTVLGLVVARKRKAEWMRRNINQELSSLPPDMNISLIHGGEKYNEFVTETITNEEGGEGGNIEVIPSGASASNSPSQATGAIGVVYAPRGYLGLVVSDGNRVVSVKQNSPLKAIIEPGDLILTVDNTDVRNQSAAQIGRIFALRENQRERKIVYQRISF